MRRLDDRSPEDFREVSYEKGACLSSQGSSKISIGKTIVFVNCIGPFENRTKEIQTGKANLRVKTYPENPAINELLTTCVENSLDLSAYPDSVLEIGVSLISDDGSLKACAINATMLALIDAGYKIKSIISSVCFGFKNNIIFIDPSHSEEELADGTVTYALTNDSAKIFSTQFEGNIKPELLTASISRAACMVKMWDGVFSK